MVYDFLITLRKQDSGTVDRVSQIMNVFALLVFGYYYYNHPKSGAAYLYFGLGIILAWLYAIIKKSSKGEAYFRLGLLIAAVGWFIGPQKNILMGILYALAGLLEKQVKFPEEIGFSTNQVSFNTFPKRVLKWNEISNALIKDGLITIDQKNNKIFQKEIEGYVTIEIEKEFNEFCYRCIHAPGTFDEVANA